jgi:hypothetical protein
MTNRPIFILSDSLLAAGFLNSKIIVSHTLLMLSFYKGVLEMLSRKSDNITIQLSSKKLEALKELSKLGIKLSDGYDYILKEYALPETTLADVRKRLSSIKTSVAKEIVEERNR